MPRDDLLGHIEQVRCRTIPVPDELAELVQRRNEKLVDLADQAPVAVMRVIAALERTAEYASAPWPTTCPGSRSAKPSGPPPTRRGGGCGSTRFAGEQRGAFPDASASLRRAANPVAEGTHRSGTPALGTAAAAPPDGNLPAGSTDAGQPASPSRQPGTPPGRMCVRRIVGLTWPARPSSAEVGAPQGGWGGDHHDHHEPGFRRRRGTEPCHPSAPGARVPPGGMT